jgi:Carboxypeptidase regulatory-like domain
MDRFLRRLPLVVLALALGAASAWAQATASISGTARDQSGAVLPGVTITATQTQTGLVRTTVTNETGSYVLPNLPLGPYRFEATLQGFNTFTQDSIVLQVNSNPVVNPTMGVGTVSEQIQVTAAATLVDTRTVGVATVVESQRIVELPLNARQVTQLITLSGVAVQTASSPGYGMNTGVRISVAGSNDFGVTYTLDGAPNSNVHDGTGLHLPFPDALQEFRLTTGAQEASSGLRSGASVSAVTRSGSNVLHGSLFEFNRDSRFNAPDFFSNQKDGLKRNQFGGTIGGPIKRDRVFFFAGYQGTTTRQMPLNATAFVPTAAMMAGDFTTFMSPACNSGRVVAPLRPPFVDNRIAPALISPAALEISRRLPAPIDECGRVFTGLPNHQNESQIPVRLDFQGSQAHSFFARYMLTTDNRRVPTELAPDDILTTGSQGPAGVPSGTDDVAHSLTLGHTYVISSSMVNSFRVVGNRISIGKPGPDFFSPQEVGINAYTYVPGYTTVRVLNGFNVGGGQFVTNVTGGNHSYGLNDDFTVVRGNHQLAFGGYYLRGGASTVSNSWAVGAQTFTGQFTGVAMGDFFAGRTGTFRQANPNPLNVEQNFAGAYVQDTWRVRDVTLNFGVKWNPFFAMSFPAGDIYNFSLDRFYAGQRSSVIPNAPPGFTYPGDPGFAGKSGVHSRPNIWDPRFGFAWDVGGDGRTSVRGGAAIARDFIKWDLHQNTSSVSPFRLTVQQANISLDNPWAGYGFNPFPYSYDPSNPVFAPYGSYLPLPPDLKPTTQYSWNLGVQRQLTNGLFASATYIGSRILNLMNAVELNPGMNLGFGACTLQTPTGPVSYPVCTNASNVNQRRLLNLANPSVALGYITGYSDIGWQDYNGLLLDARLNLGTTLNLNANYTLSKCEGLPTPGFGGGLLNPGGNTVHQQYQNNGPADLTIDAGPCPADRRHLFNTTVVYRTPEFSNRVLNAIASDWTASTVLQVRSSGPVNVVTGADIALNGFTDNTPTQRPNVVPGQDFYGDRDSLTNYFNIAAFSQPAPGTLGDATFDLLRGPGFWQWDQAFSRSFELGGDQRIELRAEAINLTNTFNKGNPAATLNNPATFGRITTAQSTPRIWQFAVKYLF